MATIRPLQPEDDLVTLTDVIHRAYAQRAAEGLRFWGTHQTVAETRDRLALGQGFVAEAAGTLVGTLTICPPQPDAPIEAYRDPGTWNLAQLAVLPAYQGQGLAKRLHDAALHFAHTRGAQTAACDTAESATRLLKLYFRWGYQPIGHHDWRPFTNYRSLVLARPIL